MLRTRVYSLLMVPLLALAGVTAAVVLPHTALADGPSAGPTIHAAVQFGGVTGAVGASGAGITVAGTVSGSAGATVSIAAGTITVPRTTVSVANQSPVASGNCVSAGGAAGCGNPVVSTGSNA